MNQAERLFLRQTIRKTFENPTDDNGNPLPKRELIVNQNRANYEVLAKEISTIAEQRTDLSLKNRLLSFVVSAHQLRSLYTESTYGFRDYFVEACYLYTQGVERQVFIEKPENAHLVSQWMENKTEQLPPQYLAEIRDLKAQNDALLAELKIAEEKEIALKTEKAGLHTKLSHLEEESVKQKTALDNYDIEKTTFQKQNAELESKLTTQNEDNKRRHRWAQRAKIGGGLATLFLIMGLLYYVYNESQKPIIWVMSSPWDGESSYRSKLIADIAKVVSDKTNKQFTIQVFHNGYLPNSTGKPVEKLSDLFIAVSQGDIQMAHYSPYYSFKDRPADVFFGSMPGGMKHEEMDHWLRNEDGQELWNQLYKPYHVLPFSCGHTGEQMGGWFKKEIKKIQDFQGLRFRIGSPIGGLVLASFGAKIDTQKIGEWQIVRKMAKNELDGAEFIGASDDYELGMAGIRGFNYYYRSCWHEPNTMNAMIINQDAFNKLPKNFQSILISAIERFGGEMFGNLKSQNETQEKFIHDNLKDIKLDSFPSEVEKALNRRASEKVNDFVDKNRQDSLFMHIYRSYKKHCLACTDWKD